MVSPEKIKSYIRDNPDLNVLLNNMEQFSDEEIGLFDTDCREELVIQYPALMSKKEILPDVIIIPGVIAKLMEAEAHNQIRNQMHLSDDNVGQIDYSNKGEKYFNVATAYNGRMLKMAQSMTAASYYREMWGSVNMPSGDFEFWWAGAD